MPVVRRSQAKNDGGGLHSPPVYPPGARNDHGFPTPQIEVRIEKEKKKDIVKPTIRTPKLEIFFLLAWLGEVFGACMASVYFLAGGGWTVGEPAVVLTALTTWTAIVRRLTCAWV